MRERERGEVSAVCHDITDDTGTPVRASSRKGNQRQLKSPRERVKSFVVTLNQTGRSFSLHCDAEGRREERKGSRNQTVPREDEGDDDVVESNFPLRNPLALAILLLSLSLSLCSSSLALRDRRSREKSFPSTRIFFLPHAHWQYPYCFLSADVWIANDRDILRIYRWPEFRHPFACRWGILKCRLIFTMPEGREHPCSSCTGRVPSISRFPFAFSSLNVPSL